MIFIPLQRQLGRRVSGNLFLKDLRELHRRGIARLISCDKPSRGRQLNAGAAQARGALLCFHHADSELGPEHVAALEKTARNESISGGAFHRRFDDRRAGMVLWEVWFGA